MAIPTSMVWEVRSTGSDLNGGGFDASARGAGTDYSQQDVPQAVYTDLTIDSTNGSKVTSAARPFVAGDTGNTLRVAAGISGFSPGVYAVVSVSGGSAILDHSIGTTGTAQASGEIRLGGAIATFSRLAADMVGSNVAFVKAGSYVEAATVILGQSASVNSTTAPTRVIGYQTSRSDWGTMPATRPVLTSTSSGDALQLTGSGFVLRNVEVHGGGSGTVINGVVNAGVPSDVAVINCKAQGGDIGLSITQSRGMAVRCEVTGCAGGIYTAGDSVVSHCYIHDNTLSFAGACVSVEPGSLVRRCIIVNNLPASGASYLKGIALKASSAFHNTLYNNGGDGIQLSLYSGMSEALEANGNIIAKSGGYGLAFGGPGDTSGFPFMPSLDGNAYWANASGLYVRSDSGSVEAVNAALAYTMSQDVDLGSAAGNDPFTNAAGGDFSLNNTAGAGALLRGTAPLEVWPGLSQSGHLDFGAIQGLGGGLPWVQNSRMFGCFYY